MLTLLADEVSMLKELLTLIARVDVKLHAVLRSRYFMVVDEQVTVTLLPSMLPL